VYQVRVVQLENCDPWVSAVKQADWLGAQEKASFLGYGSGGEGGDGTDIFHLKSHCFLNLTEEKFLPNL
jgi:hypothetical protein